MEKEEEKTDLIKSLSPYHKSIKEKLEVECRYNVEAWYDTLKDFTFPTHFLSLFTHEAKAIRNTYKNRFLHGPKLSDKETKVLENLKVKINQVLKNQFNNQPIFLRLSTRSPKDSALDFGDVEKNLKYSQGLVDVLKREGITSDIVFMRRKNIQKQNLNVEDHLSLLSETESNAVLVHLMNASKETLKVTNADEALELLTSSERVSVDIYHMLVYKDVDEKESEEELCKIIFREWHDINDLDEFRCFFYSRKLTAISQYNFYIFDEALTKEKNIIKQRISDEFAALSNFLNVENGVIDFAVQKDKIWMIELNPFNDYKGAGTGGALFHWTQDIKVLMEGPLEIRVIEKPIANCSHRISLFGAENLVANVLKNMMETCDKNKKGKEKNSCFLF